MREPRVGDIGTICHEHTSDSAALLVVEMVNQEGLTVWLADFDRDELEPVDGHCASKPSPCKVAVQLAAGADARQ